MTSAAMNGRNVAVLCMGSEVYGVGSVVRLLAELLPDVLFICFKEGPLSQWLAENRARVAVVEGLASFTVGGSLRTVPRMPGALIEARRTAARLIPLLKEEGIEIIHTHWLPQQLIGLFLKRQGFKVLWHIHNNTSWQRLFGLGRHVNHWLARSGADLLLPVSGFIAQNWQGCEVPARVVWNCAYPLYSNWQGPHAPRIRCLTAGRLTHSKGHHVAIEAVRLAREAGVEIELDIYGGPLEGNTYADELQSQVARGGLAELVTFKGFVSDIRSRHREYHIGLQCRIDPEPCGVWICEAQVDGLPLIATATGGTPELIEDGVSGCLVPPADAAALSSTLLTLAASPERLRTMRHAAYDRGRKNFTPQRFRGDVLDAYRAVSA